MSDTLEITAWARAQMDAHGLTAWRLMWDAARKRAGWCKHHGGAGTIGLSSPLLSGWTDEQCHETVLHEIAHALAGPGHGHDETWVLACLRVGAKPERCWGSDGEQPLPPLWIGTCPGGHSHTRANRKPRGPQSCNLCAGGPVWDERYLVVWERDWSVT